MMKSAEINLGVDEKTGKLARPWREWTEPNQKALELGSCRVRSTGETERLILQFEGKDVGIVGSEGLHQLSRRVKFPVEFLSRVSHMTALRIVNDRLEREGPGIRMTAMTQDDHVIGIVPAAGRWLLSLGETMDTVTDKGEEILGSGDLPLRGGFTPVSSYLETGVAELTLFSQQVKGDVRAGDVVSAGIRVSHQLGGDLSCQMLIERLICLNGMTAWDTRINWRSEGEKSLEGQRRWLRSRIEEVPGSFTDQLQSYGVLAERPLTEGESIDEIIRARGREFGFGREDEIAAIHAWNAPLGDETRQRTEWDLLNAFTQAITHDERFAERRNELQLLAGSWASNNRLVTARVRKSTAHRIGAEIVSE